MDSMIRPARIADLPELVRLEESCFVSDRLTRRSFRHLLRYGHGAMLVAAGTRGLTAYAGLLYRKGSATARLYSLAVDPVLRGRGIGRGLLRAAERTARRDGHTAISLEVRIDNRPALLLYESAGYEPGGHHAGYYADGADAQRLRKHLKPQRRALPRQHARAA